MALYCACAHQTRASYFVLWPCILPGARVQIIEGTDNRGLDNRGWTVLCYASLLAQMVAQAMRVVGGVVPYVSLCHAAAWPLSVPQSLQPFSHFYWHVSSAAWPLSVPQSQTSVFPLSAARLPRLSSEVLVATPLGPVSHSSLSQSFFLLFCCLWSTKSSLSFSFMEKPVGSGICRFRRSSWGRIHWFRRLPWGWIHITNR